MWKTYFVRHGETDRNALKMMNPWDVDSELNEKWIQQAISAGQKAYGQLMLARKSAYKFNEDTDELSGEPNR